jgi:hypothetical protein
MAKSKAPETVEPQAPPALQMPTVGRASAGLDKTDYANLLNLVARATYNGIQESAAGVALFSKLQALVNAPDKKEDSKANGNDSKGSA